MSKIISDSEHIARLKKALAASRERNRELQKAVTIDSLTRVLNRRGFEGSVVRRLQRLKEGEKPAAVLMADIDYFKRVNDTYGHNVGDTVLKIVARALSETLRPEDLVGRMGGEEFAVFLPDTGSAAAQNIAERIRIRVHKLVFPEAGKVTISIGVTGSCCCGYELEDLLKDADGALYRAKKSGRNRTVMSC